VKIQTSNPRLAETRFWWVLTNVIAWSASHKLLLGQPLQSTRDAIPMTIVVLLDGLLIGVILGAGEWVALRQITNKADGWFHATAWPYALAIAVGWFLNLAMAYSGGARMGLPILVEGAGTSVAPSLVLVLTIVGVTIGISQWLILRRFVLGRFRHGMLWILGTIVSLVSGWMVGAGVGVLTSFSFLGWLTGQNPYNAVSLYLDISNVLGGAVMGLISGGMTSSILMLLLAQHSETTALPSIGTG
jgi:hypothetical protein